MTPLSLGTVDLAAFFALLFTAQPEAPAFLLAGASGKRLNQHPAWSSQLP
jgi:hypothetical protein